MDENLVGYLLKTLDPDTERQVEAHLAADPEAGRRLDLLRQALEPLAADGEAPEPPPDLAVRTLARIAEHSCRDLPKAPKLPSGRGGGRRWWRRSDVLVAASLLLTVGLMTPSVIGHWRYKEQIAACKKNLAEFGQALHAYRDTHKGAFPTIKDEKEPFKVAGLFVPVLQDAGALPRDANVRCPAQGPPQPCPWPLPRLRTMTPEEFRQHAAELSCCYAYSLGYRDAEGNYHGPWADPGLPQHLVPIASDRPQLDATLGNSPNHGGHGQNVLFLDGHVNYFTTRNVGYERDDIFVNKEGKAAAGFGPLDAVLGHSAARPE